MVTVSDTPVGVAVHLPIMPYFTFVAGSVTFAGLLYLGTLRDVTIQQIIQSDQKKKRKKGTQQRSTLDGSNCTQRVVWNNIECRI